MPFVDLSNNNQPDPATAVTPAANSADAANATPATPTTATTPSTSPVLSDTVAPVAQTASALPSPSVVEPAASTLPAPIETATKTDISPTVAPASAAADVVATSAPVEMVQSPSAAMSPVIDAAPVEPPIGSANADLNSDSVSVNETEGTGMEDKLENSLSTGVEVEVDDNGVKNMKGPDLVEVSLDDTTKAAGTDATAAAGEVSAVGAIPAATEMNAAATTDTLQSTGLPAIGESVPTATDAFGSDSSSTPTPTVPTPGMPDQSTQPATLDAQTLPDQQTATTGPAEQAAAKPATSLAEEGATNLLPADTDIETLTEIARKEDASDIHFASNYPVFIRKDGALIPVTKTITAEQAKNLAYSLFQIEEKKKHFEESKEVDFSYTNKGGIRFRVNVYTERGNPAGAMRLINTHIRTVKELGLPEVCMELIKEPHGLILLVGPTGSGKSTTIAAMLNEINLNRREHIITIEDPVEYVYPFGKSIMDQRELEADTLSWNAALKSALREDPNIVLVGEMRDLDTIASTITIAETGHLVFATLHTNSASQAIDRIIDVFPEGAKAQIRSQLANVITAVISQRLIPVTGGGRRAALEIMLGTDAVKNAIREGKTYQIDNIIQTSGDVGMMTLEKSLVKMVTDGLITKEQAKESSVKPDEIETLLSKVGGI